MSATWLSAPGVVCALGSGLNAVADAALRGDSSGMCLQSGWVAGRDLTLGTVKVTLPPLPAGLPTHFDSRNNRLLLAAAQQIEPALRTALARHGAHRVAVVLGTSTSGINDSIQGFRHLARRDTLPSSYDYRRQELSAPAAFLSEWLGVNGPAYTISTACTSSARALLSAKRLLDMDMCDAVVCGGADTLCQLTLNGFASLEAISAERCNPFSTNRNGINIGEAAAVFLMQRCPGGPDEVALLGGGASSDGWHMSTPDPTGTGARLAMQTALRDAAIEVRDIGWLSLHGTGTRHNDAMESHAVHALFPLGVPCTSTKPLTGHALGAAGGLEAALCWAVLSPLNTQGRLPPHLWDGAADPDLPALDFTGPSHRLTHGRAVASNSFAFGGNNACLVFATP